MFRIQTADPRLWESGARWRGCGRRCERALGAFECRMLYVYSFAESHSSSECLQSNRERAERWTQCSLVHQQSSEYSSMNANSVPDYLRLNKQVRLDSQAQNVPSGRPRLLQSGLFPHLRTLTSGGNLHFNTDDLQITKVRFPPSHFHDDWWLTCDKHIHIETYGWVYCTSTLGPIDNYFLTNDFLFMWYVPLSINLKQQCTINIVLQNLIKHFYVCIGNFFW